MINTVYRKIKEMSTYGFNPRGPVYIGALVQDLNISVDAIRPMLAYLVDLRLIKYNEPEKIAVKLTLLGSTVTR